ncbi:D-aminoacylase [Roseovarius sp. HI0049]|nr:D-aminoacylase [Roseovarius sp. HI0049]
MQADLIFRDAMIVDGTGAPRRRGDVAVTGDRIVAVGSLSDWRGGVERTCSGMVLAPGFIDPHVHYDEAVLTHPTLDHAVSQGCTTVINGNCGFSIAPLCFAGPLPMPLGAIVTDALTRFASFAAYRGALEAEPASVNTACLIGHSTLRLNAMADLDREADRTERKAMCRQLDQALSEGGLGLSTGPFYPSARHSTTEELIEVASILPQHGKLYVTHMRDEGDRVIEALEETLAIGAACGCGVHVSHHKCAGLANHGKSEVTLSMIDACRARQDVGLDTTPYIASATMLDSGRHRQASKVLVTESRPHPEMAGRDLDDIAREWGTDRDGAVDRLVPALGVFFLMDEADVRRILAHELTMVCSDGVAFGKHPHPRVWGTFPRVLRYARDEGLFSLETAVRKMTSMPAERFGLVGRGEIRSGNFADIVLFDEAAVSDAASYDEPTRPARGIRGVYVNGRKVWADGTHSGERPGHVL